MKLVLEQKAGLADAARRLDLPAESLANWVRAARAGKPVDEHRAHSVNDARLLGDTPSRRDLRHGVAILALRRSG